MGDCGPVEEKSEVRILNDNSNEEGCYIYLQSKRGKDLRPDTCVVGLRIHTESLQCSDNNEDSGPATVEREGLVNKEIITP